MELFITRQNSGTVVYSEDDMMSRAALAARGSGRDISIFNSALEKIKVTKSRVPRRVKKAEKKRVKLLLEKYKVVSKND